MRIIYLAGGFPRGDDFNWRKYIKENAPAHAYVDPATHGKKDQAEYTAWDLNGIEQSNLMIVVFETSNPGQGNCCFEAGVAHANGTEVWVVDLLDESDPRKRYIGMIREISSREFFNIEAVVRELLAQ